jgi:hypothetical protein
MEVGPMPNYNPNHKDITGQRFGYLVAIRPAGRAKSGNMLWLCQCNCGKQSTPVGSHLLMGLIHSCGCERGLRRHGIAPTYRYKRHPLHATWSSIRDRCNNPKNKQFKDYGGRGIKVCKRWNNFETFLADILSSIGKRPRGRTLDRINNNGNYKKGNMRWATPLQQRHNCRPREASWPYRLLGS